MAQGDIISMVASGTYCSVPVAISLAYRQDKDDPVGVTPGRDLVQSFFKNAGGPWELLRLHLTNELEWLCVSTAWGQQSDQTFLSGATGNKDVPTTPSSVAVQVNIPRLFPHPDGYEGRFFLPGVPIADLERSGFTASFHSNLLTVFQAMLQLESFATGAANAYYLVPHASFLDPAGQTANAEAFLPYASEFVKNIGSRRPDQCGAFVGGGGGDFSPIVIPPPPP